jgi:hypothetical protein
VRVEKISVKFKKHVKRMPKKDITFKKGEKICQNGNVVCVNMYTTLKRAIRITALSLERPLRICPKVGYVHLAVQAKTHLIRSVKDIFNPRAKPPVNSVRTAKSYKVWKYIQNQAENEAVKDQYNSDLSDPF